MLVETKLNIPDKRTTEETSSTLNGVSESFTLVPELHARYFIHLTRLPMPPRRSSPISRDAIGSQDHGFDERLEFLRSDNSDAGKFPLKRRFEHRVQDAEGDVEAVYWPRRDGSKEAPEQLSLFILGMLSQSMRHCRANGQGIQV